MERRHTTSKTMSSNARKTARAEAREAIEQRDERVFEAIQLANVERERRATAARFVQVMQFLL